MTAASCALKSGGTREIMSALGRRSRGNREKEERECGWVYAGDQQ
jgi:hypothetical protein